MGLYISKKICENLNGGLTLTHDDQSQQTSLQFAVDCLNATRVVVDTNQPQIAPKENSSNRQRHFVFILPNLMEKIWIRMAMSKVGVTEKFVHIFNSVEEAVQLVMHFSTETSEVAMVVFEKSSEMKEKVV